MGSKLDLQSTFTWPWNTGGTRSKILTQRVPGAAPAGQYTYTFSVGMLHSTVDAHVRVSFNFTKLGEPSALQKSRSGETENWPAVDSGDWQNLVAEANTEGLPDKFALEQNYPNPFNPETEIRFALPAANKVVVRIFNLLGQEVRTLADKQYEAGFHTIPWDGKANNGRRVASGIYLYQLQAGSFSQVKKMTLLR